ncbi:nucleotide-binding domain-containing protein [Hypoxylon crocopeplum]|nr:nucleotide-binding domain-containing protein [Hypoxylon crocopeplum]
MNSSVFRNIYPYFLGRSPQEAPVNVVIIGGGVIGLCTAYQLAKSTKLQPDSQIKIVVLEAKTSPFQSTSSHCTGCLHYGYQEQFGDDLLPLGEYSFDIWQSIAKDDAEFRSETGYRPSSFFWVEYGDGDNIDEVLPNWMKLGGHWKLDEGEHGDKCATINPLGLGMWLEKACNSLGVEIRTSTTATEARISNDGVIQDVKCVVPHDDQELRIPCDKLVLAAGPWTPQQLRTIFPDSTLDLRSATLAGDWLLLGNNIPLNQKSIASVFLNNVVKEKLEFSGRNDGTIWVCGRTNSTAILPPLGEEALPDDQLVADLLGYSRQFIRGFDDTGDHDGTLPIMAKGRSFRPMRQSGLPLISAIPPKQISPSVVSSTEKSGVFLCYGHGSYGISLGMGSGKLMAQLIMGHDPDIDISKFTVH